MELFLQIASGIALLAAVPFLALAWTFGIVSFGLRAYVATLLVIGIPLAWLSCAGLWLYWVGGWHALWVIGGIVLLGPYVRGRYRARREEGPRVVPAVPTPPPV
jgi:hypothetical protein